ncbi:MAG: insulinase family protein [Wolbachia endosymbiont of Menacanthus eurysternus]|nr:MAG: insulinase family protein [Wolbachia endosymbiont of Menacanthus eurysternus]
MYVSKIATTKLPNGLRIVTERVCGVNSVALRIWIGLGSRDEMANQSGISHFLEHMAFKGTKTRTAFEIAKTFDDIGGMFNAITCRESTNYYIKVLKRDLKVGIDILVDILMNSTFPENELEREKNVVIQEIFQTNDSPGDIIFYKYFEAAYGDQSFGRSILGTQDIVRSFTREDLNNYVNEHYFGENMIFAVAGDVEHETIVQLIKSVLSGIRTKKLGKKQNVSFIGGEYLEYRKLDQVNLLIGLPGISRYSNKYYVFQVLNSILGCGVSSRLFQEVRENKGLAYSIYSFNSSYADTGIFSIFASTDSKNLVDLLKVIITELKKLSIDDLKRNEVDRVKERIKSQILMSRESVDSRAEALGYYYGSYNRYLSKDELIEGIDVVTSINVKEAAEKLLSQCEKTTLAAIGEIRSLPSRDIVISMLKI